MFKEDSRTELKEIVTDKLEEEVIAFLNNNGGNIYIGINDSGKVIGINANIDSLQNIIKDRIKNNISPTTIGLFDIDVEIDENVNLYDKVEVLKDNKHIEETAKYLETIPYEILCEIGVRVPRIYKN